MLGRLAALRSRWPGRRLPRSLSSRARRVLADRFGHEVAIEAAHPIANGGRIWRLLLGPKSGAHPSTAILKTTARRRRTALLREWANLQFAGELAIAGLDVPSVFGGDAGGAFFLMEDLQGATPLDRVLSGHDRRRAEAYLRTVAQGLAELHGASAGQEARYRALLAQRQVGLHDWPAEHLQARLAAQARRLGRKAPPGLRADLLLLRELHAGSAYRTFTHGDLCACNVLVRGERVALVDFEWAAFAAPTGDATALWEGFPACWDCAALPPSLAASLASTYFAELRRRDPRAPTETRFAAPRLAALARHAVRGWTEFQPERAVPMGISDSRQRVLWRTQRLLDEGGGAVFPALCELLAGMAERLERPPGAGPPIFPPFPCFEGRPSPLERAPAGTPAHTDDALRLGVPK